jgi:hypothetical protein
MISTEHQTAPPGPAQHLTTKVRPLIDIICSRWRREKSIDKISQTLSLDKDTVCEILSEHCVEYRQEILEINERLESAKETLEELLRSDRESVRLQAAIRIIDEETGRLDKKQTIEVKHQHSWIEELNKLMTQKGGLKQLVTTKLNTLPEIIDIKGV